MEDVSAIDNVHQVANNTSTAQKAIVEVSIADAVQRLDGDVSVEPYALAFASELKRY